MNTLILSNTQERFQPVSPDLTDGSAYRCENLRHRPGSRKLSRVYNPALRGRLGGVPLFADVRDGIIFMFRQDDDSSVVLDSVSRDGGDFAAQGNTIGTPGKRVKQMAAAGEFAVMLMDDGTLQYMLYEADREEYTWLGPLPDLPALSFTAAEQQTFGATAESVEFRTPVADPRRGIDSDNTARIAASLRAAWDDLFQKAADAGCWLEPVLVRTAMRLWDGSLLDVSEPVRVTAGASADWQGGARAVLQPLYDSDGNLTGTAAAQIQATGFKLAMSGDSGLGVWASAVKYLEVWVTPETVPFDKTADAVCSFSTSAGSARILAALSLRPASELEKELSESEMACNLAFMPGQQPTVIPRRRALIYTGELTGFEPVGVNRSDNCDCICGHDGFLHIASRETIVTCRRGNPFSLASQSDGLAAEAPVRFIFPQTWGGGAYTRQIVYVGHARGISALAHDAEGRHCNYRTICDRPPLKGCGPCRWGGKVAALLADGTLATLQGTKAESVVKGLDGATHLISDTRRDELWIAADAGSVLTLTSPKTLTAWTRSVGAALRSVPGAPHLIWREESDGTVPVYETADQPAPEPGAGEDPELSGCIWTGRPELRDSRGRFVTEQEAGPLCGYFDRQGIADVYIGIFGRVDAAVRVKAFSGHGGGPDKATPLGCFHVAGEPSGALKLSLRRPVVPFGPQADLVVEIEGYLDSLDRLYIKKSAGHVC